ncbi:MAG: replicative DNA helicase [Candidatus Improbicoccus pseudotrichonymphae]|uniref:Replicative DNA helicase n=1 Tax=Candidatus Improbicoccus pseudotrichonymphae TaxID=3033792 RepID=A0AA48IGU4_9FIRM|nr:MAG: replicative DNA helicase [Candidatus Improbicoccus pseudotrichonymphae]
MDNKELSSHYNLIAEQSVLGAIIIDYKCLNEIIEYLPTSDFFYLSEHRIIYSAILGMYSLGENIDYVAIYERIVADDEIERQRCKTYLLELAQIVPSVANVITYAKIVKEKKNIRNLVDTAYSIIEKANEIDDAEKILELAEQKIYEIRSNKLSTGFCHIKEIFFNIYENLIKIKKDGKPESLDTGFTDLDSVMTGLNETDLILIAGRPGMGKTSFALNIAFNIAKKERSKVAIFSLEMSKEQLTSRLISAEANIESRKLKTGLDRGNEDDWEKFMHAGETFRDLDIMIDDSAGITVSEMKSKLKRLKDVNLVIIDYLQLISGSMALREESRVQEISNITRQLKIMAKELKIPVICLSQLSRASEHRTNHRPILSDLRDSGSIEQDADVVMFLYRPSYYPNMKSEENENPNKCECIIAKNRHGETCTIDLYWQGEITRFTGMEKKY